MSYGESMETLREQAAQALRRWSFGPALAALSPRVEVDVGPPYPRRGRPIRCVVVLTCPDRDTGAPLELRSAFELHPDDDEATLRSLWQALSQRLLHEAGEALLLDGRRIADPHARPRLWPWRA